MLTEKTGREIRPPKDQFNKSSHSAVPKGIALFLYSTQIDYVGQARAPPFLNGLCAHS